MKKVLMVTYHNDEVFFDLSIEMAGLFVDGGEDRAFCGIWGRIHRLKDQRLGALVERVNHLLEQGEALELGFACHIDNAREIQERLAPCDLRVITYEQLLAGEAL